MSDTYDAYIAALREHDEELDPETACPRCQGDGKIANDDEGSPWHVWELMPDEMAMARTIGVVQPIDCPLCGGSGKKTPPAELEKCPECATSLVDSTPCSEHATQYRDALLRLDHAEKHRAAKEAVEGLAENVEEEADESTLVYDLSSWTPDPSPALVEHIASALAGTEDRWLREMGNAVAVHYKDLARVVAEVIPLTPVGFLDPEADGAVLDLLALRLEVAADADLVGPPEMVAVGDWPEGIEPAFVLDGVKVRPPIIDSNAATLLAEEMVTVELPDGQTVKVPATSVRPAQ